MKTNNVCVEGLKKIMEDAMLRVFEKTVYITHAKIHAMNKRIKNYTTITKAELIERLWNKQRQSTK